MSRVIGDVQTLYPDTMSRVIGDVHTLYPDTMPRVIGDVHRDTIIRAARTVKPKGFFFNEDFSQRVISRQKELLPDMREARERGKIAYLSFDNLVVKDRKSQ